MDVAAFAVACLSLLIGALALGWQFASWRLDGPRARATLQHGVLGRGGAAAGPVGRRGILHDLSPMREQGWNGPEVVAIEVVNVGRAKLKITGFGIQLVRGGFNLGYPQGNAWSPQLPSWLEPGERATWYAELDDATALISTTKTTLQRDASGVKMYAELGTGRRVITPQALRV
jgi:hypothetical protein